MESRLTLTGVGNGLVILKSEDVFGEVSSTCVGERGRGGSFVSAWEPIFADLKLNIDWSIGKELGCAFDHKP